MALDVLVVVVQVSGMVESLYGTLGRLGYVSGHCPVWVGACKCDLLHACTRMDSHLMGRGRARLRVVDDAIADVLVTTGWMRS